MLASLINGNGGTSKIGGGGGKGGRKGRHDKPFVRRIERGMCLKGLRPPLRLR